LAAVSSCRNLLDLRWINHPLSAGFEQFCAVRLFAANCRALEDAGLFFVSVNRIVECQIVLAGSNDATPFGVWPAWA
jgi:hypothetical protein